VLLAVAPVGYQWVAPVEMALKLGFKQRNGALRNSTWYISYQNWVSTCQARYLQVFK